MSAAAARPVHVALLGQANSIHLQRWAVALAERGLRVSVVTQQGLEALPYSAPIELHVLPHRGGSGYFFNAWALRRLLERLRPDVLHAHYASGYGTTAMLSGWQPLMLSVWGADVYDFPRESAVKRILLVRNLQAARRLASTSAAMAAQVRRVWPQAGAIDITPFGVDTRRFSPADGSTPDAGGSRSNTRKAPKQPLVIGTVKALAPKYGIDVLIRAFARLVDATAPNTTSAARDARLVLVGDGPERAALERLAAELGISGRVAFTGAVPHAEVPERLRGLDVYVAASRDDSESFGVAVIEASACGLPVVVSDAGGLPEVVVHERTGLVVPREDVEALAGALARLAADPALRARLGRAGRQRVLEHYDWPRCVDTMLGCYADLLGRPDLAAPGPGRPEVAAPASRAGLAGRTDGAGDAGHPGPQDRARPGRRRAAKARR